jgi:pSer/pThr/pTyr-binding forkhead associated (FHA) protein
MDPITDNPTSTAQSVFLIINRQIVPLVKQITHLGRQLENDVVLHEEHVSRFHAEIHIEDGKYIIYDKGSTSGTFVNSQRVEHCVLNSGDMISVASLTMMFVNNNSRITNRSKTTTKNLEKDADKEN